MPRAAQVTRPTKKRKAKSSARDTTMPKLTRALTTRFKGNNAPKVFTVRKVYPGSSIFTSSLGGALAQSIPVNNPSAATDFTALGLLFDSYKVLTCTVNFRPRFVSADVGAASSYFAPVYFVYDPDSTSAGAPASVDDCVQFQNCKFLNLFKPWRYRAQVITQTDNSVTNAALASTFDPKYGLLLDVVNTNNYNAGIIAWYATGLPPGYDFGDLIVEWEVAMFTRK